MDASLSEVVRIVEQIRPLLAGRRPEVQGAVLAELLSLWLAGHYMNGSSVIEALLTAHIEAVRNLIPVNVEQLRQGSHH